MKRKILRNLACLSAVFIVTFAIMVTTSYFQIGRQTPLSAEILETLKELNENNPNNAKLQEQVRELDLMSRKAYFVRSDRLTTGIYILAGMFLVLIVSLRLLYDGKNIPEKQLDSVDDWIVKTGARKYIGWSAGVLTVSALMFALLSSSMLPGSGKKSGQAVPVAESALNAVAQNNGEEDGFSDYDENYAENIPADETKAETVPATDEKPAEQSAEKPAEQSTDRPATQPENRIAVAADNAETENKAEQQPSIEISKVTHNGFRGNNSNGISSAKRVPDKWNLSAGTNIAWKVQTPRHGFNSPVINGNRVFMSGADDKVRELYCFELSSGKLLWTLVADNIPGSPASAPKTNEDTGLAASTVATNGKQVCAIFATGDLICADMDGNRLWAKNLGLPANHYGYASSLLVYGSSLIVQYDNSVSPRVMSFDMATGAERWNKSRTDKISWSSPIIVNIGGKPQLIVMGTPGVSSYNPDNGEVNWRVDCMSGEVGASPCSAAGIVYGASEYATLIAINAADGNALWKVNDYLPEVSSPVATKDNVFLATSYGVVACYDAQTGELKKIHELSDEFYSSPIIVEGKIYLFGNSGKMYLFSASAEFALLNSFDTGEHTFATPAFTDGKIVVRTNNSLYCVEV